MKKQEIIAMTNKIFEESFEIEKEKLQPHMRIFEDLGLDSLDVVDLVVGLQKKFGVKIRNVENFRGIRTLGDVHQFIITFKNEDELKNNKNQNE